MGSRVGSGGPVPNKPLTTLLLFSFLTGNGLRVKTQRVKTSENFSEENNLPRRFWRYPERLWNPVKVISFIFWEIFWNIFCEPFFFCEVFRNVYVSDRAIRFASDCQEWPRQTKPKKGQFMNFSQGHSRTKVRCVNRACFPNEKNQNSQKNGRDSYELFVLALSSDPRDSCSRPGRSQSLVFGLPGRHASDWESLAIRDSNRAIRDI